MLLFLVQAALIAIGCFLRMEVGSDYVTPEGGEFFYFSTLLFTWILPLCLCGYSLADFNQISGLIGLRTAFSGGAFRRSLFHSRRVRSFSYGYAGRRNHCFQSHIRQIRKVEVKQAVLLDILPPLVIKKSHDCIHSSASISALARLFR